MSRIGRRSFLRHSALSTGLALSGVLWSRRAAGSGERVRLGFIGLGDRGSELARLAMKIPSCAIAHLCDRDRVRTACVLAECQRTLPGTPAVSADWRTVVGDPSVDAVVIATPDHLHVPLALEAMEAGKHVYCEAPVGYTFQGRMVFWSEFSDG